MKLSTILYPLFGLLVIAAYAFVTTRGIEPFGTSTSRSTSAPSARAPSGAVVGGFHWGK